MQKARGQTRTVRPVFEDPSAPFEQLLLLLLTTTTPDMYNAVINIPIGIDLLTSQPLPAHPAQGKALLVHRKGGVIGANVPAVLRAW